MTEQKVYIPETPIVRKVFGFVRPLLYEHTLKYPFHGPDHSLNPIQGVAAEATKIGYMEGLGPEEIEDLAIAGAGHDIGAIYRLTRNEPIGAAIMYEVLAAWGHDKRRILRIYNAIQDTFPGIQPTGHFSYCLRDGDMANTGRPDGIEKTTLLMHEVFANNTAHLGPITLEEQASFMESSAGFLESQPFRTRTAKALYTTQWRQNIEGLKLYAQCLRSQNECIDQSIFSKEDHTYLLQLQE